eukprot:GILK01011632.1.p1 GENE.GILK01011632.1~~GILK01011632.1.p1  ORF type:complete len:225 (+),score=23.80 GILK01011632.1:53-727(+)
MANSIVLTFNGTVTIRQNDVALFNDGAWLNDTCIAFYHEWLATHKFREKSSVSFLDPSTVFWVANEDDDESLTEGLESLDLPAKDYVLMPLNDNCNPSLAAGGSHWSLLLYVRQQDAFFHFDSASSHNASVAAAVSKRFYPYLCDQCERDHRASCRNFTTVVGPQQTNCYDCGMYTLACSEHVADQLVGSGTFSLERMLEDVTPSFITKKRIFIRDLITELARQ